MTDHQTPHTQVQRAAQDDQLDLRPLNPVGPICTRCNRPLDYAIQFTRWYAAQFRTVSERRGQHGD